MEDYYMVLGVAPSATPELITRAYKQLALKLHPDRNTNQDATQAFQLLSRAYETLRDEIKRREYDRIFPSIKRDYAFPRNTQTPRPFPTSTPQSEALSEAAQIAALNKSKQERAARWKINKSVLDSSIFDLQRQISRVEQEIKNLNNIAATEAAVERQKNSWGTWLLSPIIKHAEESDEDKARKDREKQERRIEKDMKERRLETMQTDMRGREARLKQAKSEADAAIMSDDEKIRNIQAKTRARELQKQRERARVEREKMEEIRRQQQEQRVKCEQEVAEVLRKQMVERQAAEALRRQKAEKLAAEHRRNSQTRANRTHHTQPRPNPHRTFNPSCSNDGSCSHVGWWPKVQGRTACPRCGEVWPYLLQCPSGCNGMACPKCQADIRPWFYRGASRPVPPRARTPSPDYDYYDYD